MRPTWDSAGSVVVPAWPYTGWGLPGRRVTAPPVRSYRTISPLPATGSAAARRLGGVFLWHCPAGFPGSDFPTTLALRCPDFPRTPVFSPAPAAVLSATVESSSAALSGPAVLGGTCRGDR